MLVGRKLMKKKKNKEMFVLTTKLLEDPSGKKMGKTEGNMITLIDEPAEMYGKVMNWPDEMILPAFEILTDVSFDTLKDIKLELQVKKINPRDLKMQLAKEVVRIYQGEPAAQTAEENFKRVFQQGQKPEEIKQVKINLSAQAKDEDKKIGVLDLFVLVGLARSNSEVRRLIKEGAIRIDDEKIVNESLEVKIPANGLLLQKGKKQFLKVINGK